MTRRILVIDDGVSPFEPLLNMCGLPGAEVVRCGTREWGGPSVQACASRADLLVSVALEPKQHWIAFLGGLAKRRTLAPVLAVLRADASGELLAAAARVADDFILWSTDRAPELQQRIARLLSGRGTPARFPRTWHAA